MHERQLRGAFAMYGADHVEIEPGVTFEAQRHDARALRGRWHHIRHVEQVRPHRRNADHHVGAGPGRQRDDADTVGDIGQVQQQEIGPAPGSDVRVLVSHECGYSAREAAQNASSYRQHSATTRGIVLDELLPTGGGGVCDAIGERHIEVGVGAVAGHGYITAYCAGRRERQLDNVRAVRKFYAVLGPFEPSGVVLGHPELERPVLVLGFEARLDIAEDEHALEPGALQPGEVVHQRPFDTEKASRDTAKEARHSCRAYRPVEKVSRASGANAAHAALYLRLRGPFWFKLAGARDEAGWRAHRHPMWTLYFAIWIARVAYSKDARVIHAQTKRSLVAAWLAARVLRRPVLATIRDLGLACPLGSCALIEPWTTFDCWTAQYVRKCIPFQLDHYHRRAGRARRARL